MSVVNGQIANQTTFNNAFMSRTAPTTSTVAKITLANPATTTIVDAQKGMNETFDTVGMVGVGDATRKNYSTNYAVVDGDSHKVSIGKLDLKFGGFGVGHAHTGVDGDGDQLSALNLADFNPYRAAFQEFTLTTVSGLTFDVSTALAGKTPNGDNSTPGVITTVPYNNVYLIDGSDGTFVEDVGGQVVYGRITEAAGVWTLSFYTNVSGTETAYTLPSTASIKVIYREVFTAGSYPTIPSDPGQFGTLNVTADVVDASSTQRGVVSTGAQSFSGLKTFINGILNQGVFRGSIQTDSASTGSDQTIDPPTKMVLRVNNGSLTSIAGFTASANVDMFFLINEVGGDLILKNNFATTTTDIQNSSDADLTVKNKTCVLIIRNNASNRWLVLGGGGGSGGGGAAVVSTITGDTTLTNIVNSPRRLILVDATSGDIVVTMPPAATLTVGTEYQFKRVDSTANIVTINPAGSDTIDEGAQTLAYQYSRINLTGTSTTAWGAI